MREIKTAIILCGGKGTRLGELGKKIPKTLVKIHNKPILWYILKILKKNKYNQVILPLGFKGKSIRKFLDRNRIIEDTELVNTGINSNIGKRLFKVSSKIKSKNFLLLNGDAIFDFNLINITKKHAKKNNDITFIVSEITYPYGTIGIENNKIIDFKRNLNYEALKIRGKKKYTAFNYSGMTIINKKKFIAKIKNFKNSYNFEKDFFPFFIKNYSSNYVGLKGFWHSVDNKKDIDMVNNKKYSSHKYKIINIIKNKCLKIDKNE